MVAVWAFTEGEALLLMGAVKSRLHTGNASLTFHLEFIQHLLVRPTRFGNRIRHLKAWLKGTTS